MASMFGFVEVIITCMASVFGVVMGILPVWRPCLWSLR